MQRQSGVIIKRDGRQIDLDLYVPQTMQEMQIGLSGRDYIPNGVGMLFVFPPGLEPSIWMRNTYVMLNIAFLDQNGKVLAVKVGIPHSTRNVKGPAGSRYVLETAHIWGAVDLGDTVALAV